MIKEIRREIVQKMNGDAAYYYSSVECDICKNTFYDRMMLKSWSVEPSKSDIEKANKYTRDGICYCLKCLALLRAREAKEREELARKKREKEDKIYMEKMYIQASVARREKYIRELAGYEAGAIALSDEQVEHYKEWLEKNPEEVVVNG